MGVCLFARLFACSSVCLFVQLFGRLGVCLSGCLFAPMCAWFFDCSFGCWSARSCVCPCAHVLDCVRVGVSVCSRV